MRELIRLRLKLYFKEYRTIKETFTVYIKINSMHHVGFSKRSLEVTTVMVKRTHAKKIDTKGNCLSQLAIRKKKKNHYHQNHKLKALAEEIKTRNKSHGDGSLIINNVNI
jgi:hypothetical protein